MLAFARQHKKEGVVLLLDALHRYREAPSLDRALEIMDGYFPDAMTGPVAFGEFYKVHGIVEDHIGPVMACLKQAEKAVDTWLDASAEDAKDPKLVRFKSAFAAVKAETTLSGAQALFDAFIESGSASRIDFPEEIETALATALDQARLPIKASLFDELLNETLEVVRFEIFPGFMAAMTIPPGAPGASVTSLSATQTTALQAHQLMSAISGVRAEIAGIFASEADATDPLPADKAAALAVAAVEGRGPRSDNERYPMPVYRLPLEKMRRVLELQDQLDAFVRQANVLAKAQSPIVQLVDEGLRAAFDGDPKQAADTLMLANMRTAAATELARQLKALIPSDLAAPAGAGDLQPDEAALAILRTAWRFERLLRESADVRNALSGDGVFMTSEVRNRCLDDFVKLLPLAKKDRERLKNRMRAVMAAVIPSVATVKIGKEVGSGGFGVVSLGTFGGRPVAVKKLTCPDPEAMNTVELIHELAFQGAQQDPNIPTVIGVYMENKFPHVVMEQVAGKDMQVFTSEYWDTQTSAERASTLLHMLAGAVRALDAMGRRGDIHRDVKPENIMLDEYTLRAKLIDFGTAGPGDPGQFAGTPEYASPEQFDPTATLTPQSDVFSLGSTLYAAMGSPLDWDMTRAAEVPWVSPGRFRENLQGVALWGGELRPLRVLIEACWARDPKARPTTAQMLQALAGERVQPAAEGEAGLKKKGLAALNVLLPQSPLRQQAALNFQKVLVPQANAAIQ